MTSLAVITGAASGIGRGIAFKCVEMGMNVAVIDINEQALESVAQELRNSRRPNNNDGNGVMINAYVCDVSNNERVKQLPALIVNDFGSNSIQYLFNNAGYMPHYTSLNDSVVNLRKCMDVNVWSMIYFVQAFLPLLEANNAPEPKRDCFIVNTASVAAFLMAADFYHVTKAAVLALSEELNYELSAHKNMYVCCLAPSMTKTNLFSDKLKIATEMGVDVNESKMFKSQTWLYSNVDMTVSELIAVLFDGLSKKKFIIHGDQNLANAAIADRAQSHQNGNTNRWKHYMKHMRTVKAEIKQRSKL